MCLSCGCGNSQDDRGDPANITAQDLERAAEAAGISKEETAENIYRGCC